MKYPMSLVPTVVVIESVVMGMKGRGLFERCRCGPQVTHRSFDKQKIRRVCVRRNTGVPVLRLAYAYASYSRFMDDQVFRHKLLIPLMERNYGSTAEEVLVTCSHVAEFAEKSSTQEIKELQQRVNINPQVWSRLILLSKDSRLWQNCHRLPASYSALYAVSRLTNKEFRLALDQLVIHTQTSSHSVLAWTKEQRSLPESVQDRIKLFLCFTREVSAGDKEILISRLNDIAKEYDATIGDKKTQMSPEKKAIESLLSLKKEIEFRLIENCAPIFYNGISEKDRNSMGLDTVGDFAHKPLTEYKQIANAARRRLGEGTAYGEDYVVKIAYEYLKTGSRSQRYNYKRRLQSLKAKEASLSDFIEEIMERYMICDKL